MRTVRISIENISDSLLRLVFFSCPSLCLEPGTRMSPERQEHTYSQNANVADYKIPQALQLMSTSKDETGYLRWQAQLRHLSTMLYNMFLL